MVSRVQEIQGNITEQPFQQYDDEGIVFSRNIEKGLFTAAAIDNVGVTHFLLEPSVRFTEQVYQFTREIMGIYHIGNFFMKTKRA